MSNVFQNIGGDNRIRLKRGEYKDLTVFLENKIKKRYEKLKNKNLK